LQDVFHYIARDEDINVVILTGAGEAFSAGGDIRGMKIRVSHPAETRPVPFAGPRAIIMNILNLPQVLIAAVNGDVRGFGLTLALFCDIVIASENATLADTHVKVGIVAGDGGSAIWPLLVGVHRAKEFLLTGDALDAKEAERIGLINRVVPKGEVYEAAMDLAKRLANGPQKAIHWTKLSINKMLWHGVHEILDASLALEGLSMYSADYTEAINSFLEKRSPNFTDKFERL